MKLAFVQHGMLDGDDDVFCWSRDDGSFVLEIRGSSPLEIVLRTGERLEVVIDRYDSGEDTELYLLRDDLRTRIATGAIAMTVQGLHGDTLAAQLRTCGCDVRVRDARR